MIEQRQYVWEMQIIFLAQWGAFAWFCIMVCFDCGPMCHKRLETWSILLMVGRLMCHYVWYTRTCWCMPNFHTYGLWLFENKFHIQPTVDNCIWHFFSFCLICVPLGRICFATLCIMFVCTWGYWCTKWCATRIVIYNYLKTIFRQPTVDDCVCICCVNFVYCGPWGGICLCARRWWCMTWCATHIVFCDYLNTNFKHKVVFIIILQPTGPQMDVRTSMFKACLCRCHVFVTIWTQTSGNDLLFILLIVNLFWISWISSMEIQTECIQQLFVKTCDYDWIIF